MQRIAVVAICMAAVGAAYIAYSGLATEALRHAPRIEVQVSTTVDRQPVSRELIAPATKHWQTLRAGLGYFRVVGAPFNTVFLRLPGGRALAADLGEIAFDMTLLGSADGSPREQSLTPFYVLDSYERPQTLTDYWYASRSGKDCPAEGLIAACKLSSRTRYLGDGPVAAPADVGNTGIRLLRHGALRLSDLGRFGMAFPPPMIFVRMEARVFESEALRDDPVLGPIFQSTDQPTIVHLDMDNWRRWGKARGYLPVIYREADLWSIDAERELSPFGPFDGPKVYSRTNTLVLGDTHWDSGGSTAIKRERRTTITGELSYGGKRMKVDSFPARSDQLLMLIDPSRDRAIQMMGPYAKIVWIVAR